MSEMETATERTPHDEKPPLGVDGKTEGDGPQRAWTVLPRDVHFDTFNGAVCLDISRTYSQDEGFAVKGPPQRISYHSEADLLNGVFEDYGDNSTKVIICLRSRDPRDGLLPLPMTEEVYTKLAERYKFSPLSFKMLYTGLATACRYSSGGFEHCIFQQNAKGKYSLSMILSHSVARRSTVALVLGASQDEANTFIDILLDGGGGGRTPHWSALPLAALELTADDFSDLIKINHNDVWNVGHSLNMHAQATNQDKFDVKTLDLIGATRSLNSLFVKLAYYSQACQTSQSLLGDIEKMVELDLVGSDDPSERMIRAAKEDIQRLSSWYDGIQARSDYLTRRAEALLQTVYSLISQRDSAINLEIAQRSGDIAEQSMKVAELSRQDNLAMREVAIAAARDSATMRVIAAVTLFFLPPTFVATFFSTSFFDFKPTRSSDHVSIWIWLYFVLTVALIALVMGFWKLSTRHALRNIPSKS